MGGSTPAVRLPADDDDERPLPHITIPAWYDKRLTPDRALSGVMSTRLIWSLSKDVDDAVTVLAPVGSLMPTVL
ncbi:hypothetical protein AbraIFM66950_001041, partial [Aspergillus brasiliensis]